MNKVQNIAASVVRSSLLHFRCVCGYSFCRLRRPALTDHMPEAAFCWAPYFAANRLEGFDTDGVGRAGLSSCFVGSFIGCGRRVAGAVAANAAVRLHSAFAQLVRCRDALIFA